MNIEQMKGFVKSAYAGERWARKVEHMSDEQICAVYFRFQRAGKFDKKKPEAPARKLHTLYYCVDCNATYERDNPDLTECEYCGSDNIERMYMA